MISRRQLPELQAFARAEAELPFRTASEYSTLVIPNGNAAQPVHQWFKYKEAFSAGFLEYILDHTGISVRAAGRVRLLDPYCGVGTGLLSAQLLNRQGFCPESIGIECNPFSVFVARAKLAWSEIDPKRLRRLASTVLSRESRRTAALPVLSSIRSGRCISRYMAARIVDIRSRIERLAQSVERDALLVGLASSIETVSKIRRDGRALRITEKPRVTLSRVLEERWELMAQDVEALQIACPAPAPAKVFCGDGRNPAGVGVEDGTIDLILTSPPYPNNIDYNEIYKLELWLLGFVTSSEGFLELRRETFRSHPTCSPSDGESEYEDGFVQLLKDGPLCDLLGIVARRTRLLDRECSRGRSKVLLGYAYDTWRALRAHAKCLKTGGQAIYVVGNSLHGGPASRPYLIPTDLIVARLAQIVGLEVEGVIAARPLSRRLAGNHFLRDSLVVIRKA